MKERSNNPTPGHPWMPWLRKWAARHGRTVQNQMIRGASYGVGSGAVSLLVVWFQARR
jgi:hypothetical protein